ncbi:uncharacterized protein MELLADRAFT_114250 [Melampsora larici-populina 98AG31]|uniref:Uncharacterized protein n=1 Tax=Melampsora larici-populina (strain 98AG31 / pathotype 3-4-7) TaxID=747676 RepID=F4SCT1_MELLP|nr:uncharacterized protein MELLADRAFT_114250 [Melampsora larici-populina 98AG31]EGF97544.1 hypothetical protein MELLADRAFT_114250 [Melampsora larici-populina 98AG31]
MAATVPMMVQNCSKICELMTKLDSSPKEVMVTFLSSTHPEMVFRKRLMKAGLGAKTTRSIVNNLGKLACSSSQGQNDWEQLASEIVICQEIIRGHYPSGTYVSSHQITPDFFSEGAERLREEQITSGMSFLHTLIHQKLAAGMKKVDTEAYDNDKGGQDAVNVLETKRATPSDRDNPNEILGTVDNASMLSLKNLVYFKPTPTEKAAHKLATLEVLLAA